MKTARNITWFWIHEFFSHLLIANMPRKKKQMRTILCIRVMNRIGSFKKTSSNLLVASEIRTTLFFTPRGGSVTHYCCLVISKPFLCRITMGENNQMLAEWQKCLFPLTQCGNLRIFLPLRFYVKSNTEKILKSFQNESY